tara:strand:- start:169 stop:327 length:159 start_codon:yes stop_codon:yes gene_type:complete
MKRINCLDIILEKEFKGSGICSKYVVIYFFDTASMKLKRIFLGKLPSLKYMV